MIVVRLDAIVGKKTEVAKNIEPPAIADGRVMTRFW